MAIPTVEGEAVAQSIVSLSSQVGNHTWINRIFGQSSSHFPASTTGMFFTGWILVFFGMPFAFCSQGSWEWQSKQSSARASLLLRHGRVCKESVSVREDRSSSQDSWGENPAQIHMRHPCSSRHPSANPPFGNFPTYSFHQRGLSYNGCCLNEWSFEGSWLLQDKNKVLCTLWITLPLRRKRHLTNCYWASGGRRKPRELCTQTRWGWEKQSALPHAIK